MVSEIRRRCGVVEIGGPEFALMLQITYVGQVLDDGHLSVTPEVQQALQLRPGEPLRITLARGDAGGEVAEVESLAELDREELERIANFRFPLRDQRQMERLLVKNQNAALTQAEQAELERLSQESLIQCARKAQAQYLLSRRSK
jgi:hypothetical protein